MVAVFLHFKLSASALLHENPVSDGLKFFIPQREFGTIISWVGAAGREILTQIRLFLRWWWPFSFILAQLSSPRN